jgi:hypothetical protein
MYRRGTNPVLFCYSMANLETLTKRIHSFRDQSVVGSITFGVSIPVYNFATAPTLPVQRQDQNAFKDGLPTSPPRTLFEPYNSSTAVRGAQERPESSLPSWEIRIDPMSKRRYYVDHNTKKTSWIDTPSGTYLSHN